MSKKNVQTTVEVTQIACDLVEAPSVPGRVLLVPWGEVKSKSGDFTLNDEAAAAIVAAWKQHGVDLPIDWEHQSLGAQRDEWKSPDGRAPAAGWIKNLEVVPGEGLYGDVSWTAAGARDVHNKAYRYLSPVLAVRKADGVAVALHSAALTNKPAIQAAPALVAAAEGAGGGEAGGNGGDAGDAGADTLLAWLRQDLALQPDASPKDILHTLMGRKSQVANSTQLVANLDKTMSEIVELRAKLADAEVETVIAAHGNRIVPRDHEYFKDLYHRDKQRAMEWVKRQPRLCSRDDPINFDWPMGGPRAAVIHSARQQFKTDSRLGTIICTELAYVNAKLEQAGHARVSRPEAQELGISAEWR